MKTMETELQKLDERLYSLYQRSLETAKLQWLPNVTPKKDSYNSYPHIMGVMGQISRLLYEDSSAAFQLNCSELYVLLCAALMHDIGKGVQENPADQDLVPDHAFDSRRIIRERWAELGLSSEQVAFIVAEVCRFHDCPDTKEMNELYSEYYTDQFQYMEPIRGRLLGALLFLGDHMDNSITRTVPHYFKTTRLEVVGNFRSRIVDVRADKPQKMIRMILDNACFQEELINGEETLHGDLYDFLLRGKDKSHKKAAKVSILYSLAKNTVENDDQITYIRDELNIMGMPMKKWLIECDEHLFRIYWDRDQRGKEILNSVYTMEPLLNLDYCLGVLRGVCLLSGGIFGRQYFHYGELVNFIREEKKNDYKVRCAVRRLSLLLRADGKCDYSIYYDNNNWSFHCKNTQAVPAGKDQDQKELVFKQLGKLVSERVGKKDGGL